ncbi:ferrochelatase [Teredinibacter turnerae]|uniref:ferrochelatase n=1 Tax=Teredinibacter turnerae TaxID=2426 RepID=UPI0005F8593F|nr:ferrochelatase [Teredinibacter turnerae]
MQYKSQNFSHSQNPKTGVLLVNLGTPAAPTAKALKPYLKEFLSDPRVVEFPRLLWWLILNGIILNVRPRKSAAAYAKIWTERGSPLAIHTADQASALEMRLQRRFGDQVLVAWAMRYGSPSMADVQQTLFDQGVQQLLVIPLYPQYSGATTGSTFDALSADFQRRRWLPALRFVNQYHDNPGYIAALAERVRQHWQNNGRADKLILSYHGVPLRYLHAGDPYHCQCLATSRLLAEALQLTESEVITSFQSRFGREEWLQPYTDVLLKQLPGAGVKSVQIMCPGFSSDCLETVEEIGEENREYFLQNGGENYQYIPALNAGEDHIDLLEQLALDNLQGWSLAPTAMRELEQRQQRADSCPFNQAKSL